MKTEFKLSQRKARIALSPTCNLNCLYCDGYKSRRPDRPGSMEDFRHSPMSNGVISTETYFQIMQSLYNAGFRGVSFTGGEPLLNHDWDEIINKAEEIGFENINITTNGMLIRDYLNKNKSFPKAITLLGISFDTIDPVEFKDITGGGDFNELIQGLKALKTQNPNIKIKVNKVLLRSNIKAIPEYINYCEKSGLIDTVNLLNLILKEPLKKENREFFKKEFVSPDEVKDYLLENLSSQFHFKYDEKYDYEVKLPSGMTVALKDTNQTLRTQECENCPIYCQEGFYTVRVATDGTITKCIDYKGILPYIDAVEEIRKGTLDNKLCEIVSTVESSILEQTLDKFRKKYNLLS